MANARWLVVYKGLGATPRRIAHEPLELEGFAGIMFTLDIVGGVVASLCEAYRNVATFDLAGHHVNLLFDYDPDTVNVECLYTHSNLRVTLKKPGPPWIRLPSCVDPRRVVVGGTAAIPRFSGSYLLLDQQPAEQPVTVHYDLPLQTIVPKHGTRNIRTRQRGDQVLAMDNFGADLTFFDSFEN